MKKMNNMKNITVNISGAFSHFGSTRPMILSNICKIEVYDSIGYCKWNGGRINVGTTVNKDHFNFYNDNNIPINLTFTNSKINIGDKLGNEILETFHDEKNGIILVNEELRQHIRKNFPKYKLTYSVIGSGRLPEKYSDAIQYYLDLENKYDKIMIKPSHSFKVDNKIDISKYEVLITRACFYSCTKFDQHYGVIDNINASGLGTITKIIGKTFNSNCLMPEGTHDLYLKTFNPEDILVLYTLGFRQFKISGRGLPDNEYTELLNSIYDIEKGINSKDIND